MFDTDPYELKMVATLEHFEEDLKKIRTGRAHPGMLDGIKAEAYGALMPLNQVANVTAPEAQLLQVTPFDPSTLQKIAAAIREDQSLGFNPSDDGRVIRIPVPALTEERDAKRMKDAKEIGEDALKAVEKEFDRLMQDFQGKIDAAFKAKEKDILTI